MTKDFMDRLKASKFSPEKKIYSFYEIGVRENADTNRMELDLGVFDISTKTVMTKIGSPEENDGGEEIISFSNNTDFINGYLTYKTKRGIGFDPACKLDADGANVYKTIKEYLMTKKDEENYLRFEHLISSVKEIKDNKGRIYVILFGYEDIFEETQFAKGNPKWINILFYDQVKTGQPISTKSYIYRFRGGMKNILKSDPGLFRDIPENNKHKLITNFNNMTIRPAEINGITRGIIAYDVRDKKEVGLKEMTMSLTGSLHSNYYEGTGDDGWP